MCSDLKENIVGILSSYVSYAEENKFNKFGISLKISFSRQYYEFESFEDNES